MSENSLDRDAVLHLYTEYGRRLFAYACAIVGHASTAEDLVQQLFVRLLDGRVVINGPPLPYLCRAVRNAALNDRRTRARETALDGEASWLEAPPGRSLEALALERGLTALPLEQAEAIVLHIWSGLTFQEVAEVLGVSPNTAASRYRYGVAKLQEILKPL